MLLLRLLLLHSAAAALAAAALAAAAPAADVCCCTPPSVRLRITMMAKKMKTLMLVTTMTMMIVTEEQRVPEPRMLHQVWKRAWTRCCRKCHGQPVRLCRISRISHWTTATIRSGIESGSTPKAELNPARYAWLCAFAEHEKAPPVQAIGRHAQNEAFVQGGANPSYAVREVADGHMMHARHAHELVVQAIQWERDRVADEMHALRDQNELLRKALKLAPVLHDVDHQAKGRGNKYHRSRLSPALIRKLKPYATLKPSQRTQRLKMIRVACMMLKACSGGMAAYMAAPFPALASVLALPMPR